MAYECWRGQRSNEQIFDGHQREAVKGGSVIAAVRQSNKSGYVLALKLIFGTLNLRIFESLTADNSGYLVNAAFFTSLL